MAKRWGSVLGILFSLLIIVATAFFLRPTPPASSHGAPLASLTLFTFPILLALFFHGPLSGWIFFGIASFTVFFFSLRESDGQLLGPFFVFLPAFLLSLLATRRMHDRGKELEVELERLEREENLMEASGKRQLLQSPLLEGKLVRYRSLSQVAQFLNETLSLREVARRCVKQAKTLIGPSDGSFLFLIEEGSQEIALVASEASSEPFRMKSKQGDLFTHWVVKNRRPLLVQDTHRDFRFDLDQVRERAARSLIIAPLFSEKRLSGAFRLENGRVNGYEADDLRFFSILADLASMSLENAQLYHRTEELARVDELTGLFVYRYFQERLGEELHRAQRAQRPLSLLMIDIDHFKRYNDQYGHIAGDLVLKQVAQILKRKVREGDFVCRYGGEEFAVILPHRPKEEAVALAEKLRATVAETDFTLRRETTHVTLSIGMATYPGDAPVQEDLLKQVDTFLYQAKRLGRNRVCSS